MKYTALEGNIGELKFYGDISEWWINGEDFTTTLQEMAGKFKTIHMRVHCYGGSVFEGNVMYNAMLRCKSEIIVYIDGVAASMMSIVMLAAKKIIAAENAFIMIHCPTVCLCGNAKQVLEAAKLLQGMEKNFCKTYARKSGKAEKEVQKWFDGSDHWFSAEEAKTENLIDQIESPIVTNVIELDKPTEEGQEETVFNRFAALMTAPINQNLNQENSKMKKELIAQFGLTGVTENSTDAEIQAALKTKMDGASETGKTIMKAAVEAVISGVEKATGKTYEPAMRTQLVTVGETSGLEVLQAMLGLNAPATEVAAAAAGAAGSTSIPQVITMVNGGAGVVAETRKDWGWDKWQAEDSDGIEKLEKENPTAFNALYNAKFGTNL